MELEGELGGEGGDNRGNLSPRVMSNVLVFRFVGSVFLGEERGEEGNEEEQVRKRVEFLEVLLVMNG